MGRGRDWGLLVRGSLHLLREARFFPLVCPGLGSTWGRLGSTRGRPGEAAETCVNECVRACVDG